MTNFESQPSQRWTELQLDSVVLAELALTCSIQYKSYTHTHNQCDTSFEGLAWFFILKGDCHFHSRENKKQPLMFAFEEGCKCEIHKNDFAKLLKTPTGGITISCQINSLFKPTRALWCRGEELPLDYSVCVNDVQSMVISPMVGVHGLTNRLIPNVQHWLKWSHYNHSTWFEQFYLLGLRHYISLKFHIPHERRIQKNRGFHFVEESRTHISESEPVTKMSPRREGHADRLTGASHAADTGADSVGVDRGDRHLVLRVWQQWLQQQAVLTTGDHFLEHRYTHNCKSRY